MVSPTFIWRIRFLLIAMAAVIGYPAVTAEKTGPETVAACAKTSTAGRAACNSSTEYKVRQAAARPSGALQIIAMKMSSLGR